MNEFIRRAEDAVRPPYCKGDHSYEKRSSSIRSSVIELNIEELNKINLTRIDMEAVGRNVPFPRIVPSFPWVTTDNNLDYGKKMKEE